MFAPTDKAFAKLPEGTLETLLKPENKAKLQSILTYRVVSGKVVLGEVVKLDSVKTVHGGTVSMRTKDGAVLVNDARVITVDVTASNGVIHVIDAVMLPEQQERRARREMHTH